MSSKKKENKSELVRFSRKEIDELCDEWEPAPLVNEVTELENWELKSVPEIIGQNGAHVKLNNKTAVNLASQDFLNLNENDRIKESARVEIRSAGVGACGPPNFTGPKMSTSDWKKIWLVIWTLSRLSFMGKILLLLVPLYLHFEKR